MSGKDSSMSFGFSVKRAAGPIPIGSFVVPFWDMPYRILHMNHKKELLRSLWVFLGAHLRIISWRPRLQVASVQVHPKEVFFCAVDAMT